MARRRLGSIFLAVALAVRRDGARGHRAGVRRPRPSRRRSRRSRRPCGEARRRCRGRAELRGQPGAAARRSSGGAGGRVRLGGRRTRGHARRSGAGRAAGGLRAEPPVVVMPRARAGAGGAGLARPMKPGRWPRPRCPWPAHAAGARTPPPPAAVRRPVRPRAGNVVGGGSPTCGGARQGRPRRSGRRDRLRDGRAEATATAFSGSTIPGAPTSSPRIRSAVEAARETGGRGRRDRGPGRRAPRDGPLLLAAGLGAERDAAATLPAQARPAARPLLAPRCSSSSLLPLFSLFWSSPSPTLARTSPRRWRRAPWPSASRTTPVASPGVCCSGRRSPSGPAPPRPRRVETLVALPVVMPPAVAGIALLLAFGRRGLVGRCSNDSASTVSFSSAAVVLAQVFVSAPFYVKGAGRVEARRPAPGVVARSLGAGPRRGFCRVALPLARRGLVAGAAWPGPAPSASSAPR